MKIDDSPEFETFRVIAKRYDSPEDITPSERKRLRELGLEVD